MKNIIVYSTCLYILFLSFGCNDNNSKNVPENFTLDYYNPVVLDSLINVRPISEDTIFLGFRIGMSKDAFIKHIKELKNENKKISFHKSVTIRTGIGPIELGDGYVFTSPISTEESGKTITGIGQYFLSPQFSKNRGLIGLDIYPTENWEGISAANNQTWIRKNIQKNSTEITDQRLIDMLQSKEVISTTNFIRKKGNLLIYSEDFAISYKPMQVVFMKIKIKNINDSLIQQSNEDIKF